MVRYVETEILFIVSIYKETKAISSRFVALFLAYFSFIYKSFGFQLTVAVW